MEWQSAYYQAPHDFRASPFTYPQLSQVIKITPFIAGSRVRLCLTNRFGVQRLTFERIAISDTPTFTESIELGALTVQPGQEAQTNEASLTIVAGQPVYVLMVAQQEQTYCDYACTYEASWVSAGITRRADKVPRLNDRWQIRKSWFSFAGLEVLSDRAVTTVNLTGDSLVETGMLAAGMFELSQRDCPGQITWRMTGISGNRLVLDEPQNKLPERTFGPALLNRLADVTTEPASLTVALIGGNDLLLPLTNPGGGQPVPEVATLIKAYQRLADYFARERQILLLPTLAPLRLPGDPAAFKPGEKEVNQKRLILNQWLRGQAWIIDTADAMTAPEVAVLNPADDFGDHLHLSPVGGRHLARLLWPRIKDELGLN